jgi:hypothetical protein
LIAVKTNVKVKADETDRSGDFSPAKAETYTEPLQPPLHLDRNPWEDKVRRYTAPFQRYGNIYAANSTFTGVRENRWFVSSDGAAIQPATPPSASPSPLSPKLATAWNSHGANTFILRLSPASRPMTRSSPRFKPLPRN